MAFTGVGGVIPGTLFGAVPHIARTPAAAAGIVGLLIQGAGIGQLLGPPLFAWAVAGSGSWRGAWLFTAAAMVALLILAGLYAHRSRIVGTDRM